MGRQKNSGDGVSATRTIKTDYKQLRRINPEAARKAVLDYLKKNNHNISDAATAFSINRTVVYDILKRSTTGNLKDKSRVPKNQPKKTPQEIENIILKYKYKTQLNPKELAEHLKKHEGIDLSVGTIRHIINRLEKNHRLIDIHLAGG